MAKSFRGELYDTIEVKGTDDFAVGFAQLPLPKSTPDIEIRRKHNESIHRSNLPTGRLPDGYDFIVSEIRLVALGRTNEDPREFLVGFPGTGSQFPLPHLEKVHEDEGVLRLDPPVRLSKSFRLSLWTPPGGKPPKMAQAFHSPKPYGAPYDVQVRLLGEFVPVKEGLRDRARRALSAFKAAWTSQKRENPTVQREPDNVRDLKRKHDENSLDARARDVQIAALNGLPFDTLPYANDRSDVFKPVGAE